MREDGIELVVTSGGLGPTADDLTAEVVAKFAGRELRLDEEMEEKIHQIIKGFAARSRMKFDPDALREANRKQAMVPEGATALDPLGPAPGLVVPADGMVVIVLPGPAARAEGDCGRTRTRELRPRARCSTAPSVRDLRGADVRDPGVRAGPGPARDRGRRRSLAARDHDLPARRRAGHGRPPPFGRRGGARGAARRPEGEARPVHLQLRRARRSRQSSPACSVAGCSP